MTRTRYHARSPTGMVIPTDQPTVADALSRGGWRVSAVVEGRG